MLGWIRFMKTQPNPLLTELRKIQFNLNKKKIFNSKPIKLINHRIELSWPGWVELIRLLKLKIKKFKHRKRLKNYLVLKINSNSKKR